MATYILARLGPMSMGKLQALVYYAQAWSVVTDGAPLTMEPCYAERSGPVFRSITAKWLRHQRAIMRAADRRARSLRRRCRRWAIQEERKRGGRERCHRLNIPGWWTERDAVAQRAGLAQAWGEPPAP